MGKGRKNKKPFTLEVYDHFFHNRSHESFTIDLLNEVIFMHGFKKIHKRPKSEVYDALSTIDLINPQRSTLKDNNNLWPYDSSVSVDQVKQDLDALNWPECHVQSIQTIGQSHSASDGCRGANDGTSSMDILISSFKMSRKRPRSKRMRSIISITRSADVDSLGASAAAASESAGVEDDSSLFLDTYSWDF